MGVSLSFYKSLRNEQTYYCEGICKEKVPSSQIKLVTCKLLRLFQIISYLYVGCHLALLILCNAIMQILLLLLFISFALPYVLLYSKWNSQYLYYLFDFSLALYMYTLSSILIFSLILGIKYSKGTI